MLKLLILFALSQWVIASKNTALHHRLRKRGVQVQTSKLKAFTKASPNIVTDQYLQLDKREYWPNCSSQVQLPVAIAELVDFNGQGIEYLADVQINGQTVPLIVDTGSSDTWSIAESYQCFNKTGAPVDHSGCNFARGYIGDFVGDDAIPNQLFDLTYGDETWVSGKYGYANVTVGGLTVTRQQMALANESQWNGQGENAGILGLAYPELVASTNATTLRDIQYSPYFTTAVSRSLVNPVFSIAINRGGKSYLALGGLPPLNVTGDYARTPIIKTRVFTDQLEYNYYSMIPDALIYPGAPANNTAIYAVDSGASFTLLPAEIASSINSGFVPPATLNEQGTALVPCTATEPDFGIVLGGKIVRPRGLKLEYAPGACLSAIQSYAGSGPDRPIGILGDTFMNGLVTVFDVGAAELRFTSIVT